MSNKTAKKISNGFIYLDRSRTIIINKLYWESRQSCQVTKTRLTQSVFETPRTKRQLQQCRIDPVNNRKVVRFEICPLGDLSWVIVFLKHRNSFENKLQSIFWFRLFFSPFKLKHRSCDFSRRDEAESERTLLGNHKFIAVEKLF